MSTLISTKVRIPPCPTHPDGWHHPHMAHGFCVCKLCGEKLWLVGPIYSSNSHTELP